LARCFFFVVLILVYIVISEVFAVLLRLTGLTEEKAKFQVISLLTNSGFTTQESEIIMATPERKGLAKIMMLFGYAFTVTIVSSVINIFLAIKLNDFTHFLIQWTIPIIALVIGVLIMRSMRIKQWFDSLIEKQASKRLHSDKNNVQVLDTYADRVIARVYLRHVPENLRETAMAQTGLREENDLLIMLQKSDNEETKIADGNTILKDGDTLIAFGAYDTLCHVFEA